MDNDTTLIKKVRVAYAHGLFEKQSVNDGAPTYSASFVFARNHPAYAIVAAKVKEVAKAKWGAKADGILKEMIAGGKICLRDGNTKASQHGFADNWFVSASNPNRFAVVGADGRTPLSKDDGIVYSGCYVNAALNLWAQDNKYGKRVNASITGIQFAGPGERWGGGAPSVDPTEVFSDISGEFEDDDDEIGL